MRTAIDIDEYTPGAPLTSMVDDVFFIVQKCGRRALATGNVQCACAVLGAGNGLLGAEMTAALDAKWKVSEGRGAVICVSHTLRVAMQTRACAMQCDAVSAVTPTHPHFCSQAAASRLTQLLGTALDAGADVSDDAAQPAAVFNDVDACAQ